MHVERRRCRRAREKKTLLISIIDLFKFIVIYILYIKYMYTIVVRRYTFSIIKNENVYITLSRSLTHSLSLAHYPRASRSHIDVG